MKIKLLVLVWTLFFFSSLFSQNKPADILQTIFASMKSYESNYVCKAERYNGRKKDSIKARVVNNGSFDSLLKRSANRILTGTEEGLKNGRAAVLDFNEALKRLSINYGWKPLNNENTQNNLTFNAESASKKYFELFGKSGWKEGFSLGFGQSIRKKNLLLFLPKNCTTLSTKRQGYYGELIEKYSDVLSSTNNQIASLRAKKIAYDNYDFNMASSFDNLPTKLTKEEAEMLKLYDELNSINLANPNEVQNIFENEIQKFELANFQNFGYRIKWFNWNVAGGLAQYSIYDTAVKSIAKIDKEELFKIAGIFSWNYFRESAHKNLTYFSVEGAGGNTNYLEEIIPSEIEFLKEGISGTSASVKENYDALILKDYDQLKKNYLYLGTGFIYNYFPNDFIGKGRFLGVELASSTKFKLFEPDDVKARDVFSIRGGILFSFEQDKVSKTTIGLIAQLKDVPYNDITSKDRFSVGIRIGVPFNY